MFSWRQGRIWKGFSQKRRECMGSKKYIFRDVISLSSFAVKTLFYHGVVLCGLKFVDKPAKNLEKIWQNCRHTRHAGIAQVKGTVAWYGFFSLIASYPPIQDEREDLKFFSCSDLGEDLTQLALKENTQKDIFLWDRRKILIAFCFLGLNYKIRSPMFEILTLWSPHKLLKNLGSLSEYYKCSQSSTKI